MSHSTARPSPTKPTRPEKPRPDFPLFPHATGRWAKKVKGKTHYFGPWSDPDGALNLWLEQKDDLLAGRIPRRKRDADAVTLADLANAYLTTQRGRVTTGEITTRTFASAYKACEAIISFFGGRRLVTDIRPEDFESYKSHLAGKGYAPKTINVEISRTRSLFHYGLNAGLLDRPVLFGPGFRGISKKAERRLNANKPPKMYEADELRRIIDAASPQMKAMVLLGVNCGLGNHDLAHLPKDAVDLDAGWIHYARSKTGVDRRCPLWPETVEAIREAIRLRPTPANPADDNLIFLTARGARWVRFEPGETPEGPGRWRDALTIAFAELLRRLKLKQYGRNFYALRHTFRTIADESLDQAAAGAIMGHVDQSMAGHYRQRISDERLSAVVNHVRQWLFPPEPEAPNDQAPDAAAGPADPIIDQAQAPAAAAETAETDSPEAPDRTTLKIFRGFFPEEGDSTRVARA